MKFKYPLQWPPQQPRTKRPVRAIFGNHSVFKAGKYLSDEIKKLKATDVIISSNLQIKQDGTLASRQYADDNGIVVYFKLKGEPKAMACDKYDRPEHNLWALQLSVAAIRGLERWGGAEFLDGLFTGFKALPSPDQVTNTTVRYFPFGTDLETGKAIFKNLAMELHPDKGGDSKEFMELNKQFVQFRQGFQ